MDTDDSFHFEAFAPPDKVGGTCRNADGESYMKFRLHPESAQTAPGPGGMNSDYTHVTIKRSTIKGARADEKDPEALMLETDVGWTHVTGVPVDEVLAWLLEGQDEGDTGKPKEGEGP